MLEGSGLGSDEGERCDLKSGGSTPPRGVLYNILNIDAISRHLPGYCWIVVCV